MTAEEMPPMPARYQAVTAAYAEMLAAVREAAGRTGLTPQIAMVLATIGDKSISVAELRRGRYFVTTNTSYFVRELADRELIEKGRGLDLRLRPIKLTPKGREIAIAIRKKLSQMRDAELARAETSA